MKHFLSGPQWVQLSATLQTDKSLFHRVSTGLSAPHAQQWIRPVSERRGLLLHQDLLWDCGCQFCSSFFPAGSGPGPVLSSQLGLQWFTSGLRAPDSSSSQTQVQLQLWTGDEQAQSTQPVSTQQLLADPLRTSLSGGCSSLTYHSSDSKTFENSTISTATKQIKFWFGKYTYSLSWRLIPPPVKHKSTASRGNCESIGLYSYLLIEKVEQNNVLLRGAKYIKWFITLFTE